MKAAKVGGRALICAMYFTRRGRVEVIKEEEEDDDDEEEEELLLVLLFPRPRLLAPPLRLLTFMEGGGCVRMTRASQALRRPVDTLLHHAACVARMAGKRAWQPMPLSAHMGTRRAPLPLGMASSCPRTIFATAAEVAAPPAASTLLRATTRPRPSSSTWEAMARSLRVRP